jgi:hypothetical protein
MTQKTFSSLIPSAEELVKFFEEQAEADKEAAAIFAKALFKLERSSIKLETMYAALLLGGHDDAAQILNRARLEIAQSQKSIVDASIKMSSGCHVAFTTRLNELKQ